MSKCFHIYKKEKITLLLRVDNWVYFEEKKVIRFLHDPNGIGRHLLL